MPQGTARQRWLALLIAGCVASGVAGCSVPKRPGEAVHPSTGTQAKTLEHIKTIGAAGLGSGDHFKRFFVGPDVYRFIRPVSLAVRDHLMYVADAGQHLIFKYDFNTERLTKVGNAGGKLVGEAGGIYIDPDYSFYVADPLGKQVLHFAPNGKLLKRYSDAPNISRPIAVTVDQERGEVLVADEVYSHIVAFEKDAAKPSYGIGRRGNGPGRFRVITDMVQTDGKLYVTDRVELRLQVLDRAGEYIDSFGQEYLMFPQALAVADNGYVFVSDRSDGRIKVFHKGELVDVVGRNGSADGEFRIVTDMALADGKLYVADSLNQRIQIFRVLPKPALQSAN